MRKVMAIAAVPGLIAAICIFFASFFGLTMDKLGGKAFLLHLGIFALAIPLIAVERWSKGWTRFAGNRVGYSAVCKYSFFCLLWSFSVSSL
jgi:hypothetical protein